MLDWDFFRRFTKIKRVLKRKHSSSETHLVVTYARISRERQTHTKE
jgi:hypothetical protein